jgi:hypothetical protein
MTVQAVSDFGDGPGHCPTLFTGIGHQPGDLPVQIRLLVGTGHAGIQGHGPGSGLRFLDQNRASGRLFKGNRHLPLPYPAPGRLVRDALLSRPFAPLHVDRIADSAIFVHSLVSSSQPRLRKFCQSVSGAELEKALAKRPPGVQPCRGRLQEASGFQRVVAPFPPSKNWSSPRKESNLAERLPRQRRRFFAPVCRLILGSQERARSKRF